MNLLKMATGLLVIGLITFFCVIASDDETGSYQEFYDSIDGSVLDELQKFKANVKREISNDRYSNFRPEYYESNEESDVDGFREVDETEDFEGKEKYCLTECKCQFEVSIPTIDCDQMKWDHIPLPVTRPLPGYHHLSLTCNDIETVPEYDLFVRAFPHVHIVDLRGNPNLNCTSLRHFNNRVKYYSDCGGKPTRCHALPVKPESMKVKYDSDEELAHDLSGRLETILELIKMHTDIEEE